MILKITELVVTEENEKGFRTYEYVTAADNAVSAIKNYLYEFDTDNVFNCDDLFEGECISSTIHSIEVLPYEYF